MPKFKSSKVQKPLVTGYDYDIAYQAEKDGELTEVESELVRLRSLSGFYWSMHPTIMKQLVEAGWMEFVPNPRQKESLAVPEKIFQVSDKGIEARSTIMEKLANLGEVRPDWY